MKLFLFALMFIGLAASSAFAQSVVVNEAGPAGAPVSAANGTATKIIASVGSSTDWSFMPEGADIRCNLRTSADGRQVRHRQLQRGFSLRATSW